MEYRVGDDADETTILQRCRSGEDQQKLFADFFMRHREKLKCMVRLRLDRRVQARFDPSDVLQEAYVEAARRFQEYLRDPPMPFFLWLWRVTGQKLLELQHSHLGIQKRAVGREIRLQGLPIPHTTSEVLAQELMRRIQSPSTAAESAELRQRLEAALDQMDATSREIVALRHFEQLSSVEASQVLGITEPAARKRYVRAMKKLKDILADIPGGLEGA